LDTFLKGIPDQQPIRVPGIACYMTSNPSGTPLALMHNLKHNKVLHEYVIVATISTRQIPHVPNNERVDIEPLFNGFYRMKIYYGFMEEPDIPKALEQVEIPNIDFKEKDVTYFLGRETVIASKRPGMAIWREKLFALMSRNATTATAYFCLPSDRVVEIGAQVEI
jgi:KUP system potassium uptake protein